MSGVKYNETSNSGYLEYELNYNGWYRLNKIGSWYCKHNNFVAMDLADRNQLLVRSLYGMPRNTGFISSTQIPEFTALSGYPILFLCSIPRTEIYIK